jgi:hypothetical protein
VRGLWLHHFYRTMARLGEPLPDRGQAGATPFSPRSVKEPADEGFFTFRQDLFSQLDPAFFDTTSICFEGQGCESLGRYGNTRDRRPDHHQMVLGLVLDGSGRPLCCEL